MCTHMHTRGEDEASTLVSIYVSTHIYEVAITITDERLDVN